MEPVFGLRLCPLPPALQWKEHPFPAPSSSLGWCRMQSGNCKWSWGQALAGAGMSDVFSCSLDLSLRSPTYIIEVFGWGQLQEWWIAKARWLYLTKQRKSLRIYPWGSFRPGQMC